MHGKFGVTLPDLRAIIVLEGRTTVSMMLYRNAVAQTSGRERGNVHVRNALQMGLRLQRRNPRKEGLLFRYPARILAMCQVRDLEYCPPHQPCPLPPLSQCI